MNAIVQAVIFLPYGAAIDGTLAAQCLEHIGRRGYQLLTVARDWSLVESLIRAGRAQVIVFARREHFQPDWTPRIEFVGQDTRENRPGLVRRNAGRDGTGRPRVIRRQPSGE